MCVTFIPLASTCKTLWFISLHLALFFLNYCLSADVERAASLPELTPAQRNKLRHLSIISLASNLKVLIHSFLSAFSFRKVNGNVVIKLLKKSNFCSCIAKAP